MPHKHPSTYTVPGLPRALFGETYVIISVWKPSDTIWNAEYNCHRANQHLFPQIDWSARVELARTGRLLSQWLGTLCDDSTARSENVKTARQEAPERSVAEGVKAEMRGPAEAGPVALISDCALPALLPALFSRHHVCEEILVLRREALRKLENLKAVAITDGPELDVG
jgi:hypothetical protein